ncbi:MAG TPA: methyltransferase domain-containing protein [Terriglobia bacterium]|nr:methyltransferase domain-containing protein [Terriglobia bacterium]
MGRNPTLAYMFRKYLATRLLASLPTGTFLEIGVGSGTFYEVLASRGFEGLCMDLNPLLIEEHQSRMTSPHRRIRFVAQDFFALEESFDLVLAFEVLEHYREDDACLRKWFKLLNPGGTLLISVPAHMRHWTSNDERAGHARRYEKAELRRKLMEQGFQILNCWCYGFPILNLTYPLSQILTTGIYSDREKAVPADPAKDSSPQYKHLTASVPQVRDSIEFLDNFSKTALSGTRRFYWLSRWVFHEALWFPFLQIQKVFLNADMGIGYLVKCQRDRT